MANSVNDPGFLAQLIQQAGQNPTPMTRAIAGGQVTPDELMPRLSNTPIFGATRPDLTGLVGQAQGALPAGAPPRILPTNNAPLSDYVSGAAQRGTPGPTVIPSSGQPIPMGAAPVAAESVAPSLANQAGMASNLPTAAGAVTPAVEAGAAGAAGGAAAIEGQVAKGMLGKINNLFPSLGLDISARSLGAGAGVALAGLAAGGFVDSLNVGGENSNWDQGLTGALKGAGIGGGLAIAAGLGAGPIGWAVLGGAALFGIGNAFLSHDSGSTKDQMQTAVDKANHTIDTLISNPAFGVDTYTSQLIKTQVAASTAFYMDQKDKAGLDQYLKGLAQTVPSFLMEAQQRNQVTQEKLKLQASFGPVYAKMMDRSSTAAQQAYQSQMQAAQQIRDPQIRASLISQAGQSYSASQDLRTAYAQQAALLPGQQSSNPGVQQVDQQAASLVQQYMSPTR